MNVRHGRCRPQGVIALVVTANNIVAYKIVVGNVQDDYRLIITVIILGIVTIVTIVRLGCRIITSLTRKRGSSVNESLAYTPAW